MGEFYDAVVENGTWLESLTNSDIERYATDGEESVWVCHKCEEADIDPDEHCCDEDYPVFMDCREADEYRYYYGVY